MSKQSNSKKNKRGERGSTEESTKVAKKPNIGQSPNDQATDSMADGDTILQEQPTLSKLRDMLT